MVRASLGEELTALFLSVGVEPPLSLKNSHVLSNIIDGLRVLKSVVGTSQSVGPLVSLTGRSPPVFLRLPYPPCLPAFSHRILVAAFSCAAGVLIVTMQSALLQSLRLPFPLLLPIRCDLFSRCGLFPLRTGSLPVFSRATSSSRSGFSNRSEHRILVATPFYAAGVLTETVQSPLLKSMRLPLLKSLLLSFLLLFFMVSAGFSHDLLLVVVASLPAVGSASWSRSLVAGVLTLRPCGFSSSPPPAFFRLWVASLSRCGLFTRCGLRTLVAASCRWYSDTETVRPLFFSAPLSSNCGLPFAVVRDRAASSVLRLRFPFVVVLCSLRLASSRGFMDSTTASGKSVGASSLPPRAASSATEPRDELRITIISLSGKRNFVEWVHSVRRVLQTKGLLHHLTRATPTVPTDERLRDDDRVQSWFLNSMDTEPYRMVMYHDTAKSMWEELHSYSCQNNLQHLFDIITDLQSLDPGIPSDMTSFVARTKTLVEAWIQHQPPPTDLVVQRAKKRSCRDCHDDGQGSFASAQCSSSDTLLCHYSLSLSDVCSMLLKVTLSPEAPLHPFPALLQLPSPHPSTRGTSTPAGVSIGLGDEDVLETPPPPLNALFAVGKIIWRLPAIVSMVCHPTLLLLRRLSLRPWLLLRLPQMLSLTLMLSAPSPSNSKG
ncbi:hypothetical protein KSP39_PZI015862 [Platanthera zijinensis]|uniref:UBN2_3 domain-containing protein n=1 Tax=Platanthera zijinensis TaxID=2320716 RepID=A0AAP0B842_9ASPA